MAKNKSHRQRDAKRIPPKPKSKPKKVTVDLQRELQAVMAYTQG